jgi:hypothetical protein
MIATTPRQVVAQASNDSVVTQFNIDAEREVLQASAVW